MTKLPIFQLATKLSQCKCPTFAMQFRANANNNSITKCGRMIRNRAKHCIPFSYPLIFMCVIVFTRLCVSISMCFFFSKLKNIEKIVHVTKWIELKYHNIMQGSLYFLLIFVLNSTRFICNYYKYCVAKTILQ